MLKGVNKYRYLSLSFCLSLLLLSACSSPTLPPDYQQQRDHFVNAIEQAQQAGSLLQQAAPNNLTITQAMDLLDSSMLSANSVEADFLKWLDSGLYQAFSAYLIKGIENYRLGVELDDRTQQAKGIELLQKWWHFWQLKRPSVYKKLEHK